MGIVTLIVLFVNGPWYFAEYIEKLTGYYPEWIVDVFGGMTSGMLDMGENIGSFIMKLFE